MKLSITALLFAIIANCSFGQENVAKKQVQGYVGYRFSKLIQTTIGYRIIGIDYDKGTGEDRFRYDMNTFGPNVRFGFNF